MVVSPSRNSVANLPRSSASSYTYDILHYMVVCHTTFCYIAYAKPVALRALPPTKLFETSGFRCFRRTCLPKMCTAFVSFRHASGGVSTGPELCILLEAVSSYRRSGQRQLAGWSGGAHLSWIPLQITVAMMTTMKMMSWHYPRRR